MASSLFCMEGKGLVTDSHIAATQEVLFVNRLHTECGS